MKSAKLLKLLYVQVLIGLVLGITVGHYWPEFGAALKPLGDGFVKLVKMMIAPIVFCTIVSGITSLGDSKRDRQDAAQVDGPVLRADDPRPADRPGRGLPAAAGRRHAHRSEAPRRRRGREVRQPGAAARLHRVRAAHHSRLVLRRLCRRRGAAGAAALGAVRLRADAHRHGRARRARRHRRLRAHAVRGLRLHHAARAARRVRRDGLHRRALRHQVDRLARPADRHVLRRLHLLRRRRARHAGPDARLQAVAAAALHPRGAAGRARHVVERAGAAAPADEARAPGLQEGRGRAGAADRLFVQPRRHGDLPDAGVDVHRPGLRHPRCRGPRSARCSA